MEWNSYLKRFELLGVTVLISTCVSLFNAGSLLWMIKKIDHLKGDKMTIFDSQQHITCDAKHFCVRNNHKNNNQEIIIP